VRVSAFTTTLAALVPRALAAFRHEHPAVALALAGGRTPTLLDQLRGGDTDVAVVSAPWDQPLDSTRFTLQHLLDEHLLVAVPAGPAGAPAHRAATSGCCDCTPTTPRYVRSSLPPPPAVLSRQP
jgi:DNA-binding transcriptional LysR family regulator